MRLLFYTLFICCLFLINNHLSGQSAAKDIYQLFGLKQGGCTYTNFKMAPLQEEAVEDAFIRPNPPVTLPEGDTPLEAINNFFAPLRAELKDEAAYHPKPISLSKENEGFFQKGKWGVRNKSGKVLLKPQFDYIIKHKDQKGFAGYKGTKCKYYNQDNAKVIVNKEYYSIKPIDEGIYTVQSKNGIGLYANGKEIAEARYKHVMKEGNTELTYYNLGNTLILLDDLKSTFPYSWNGVKYIGQNIVVGGSNVYDIKNKRKLICERKGYSFAALSKDLPLISVQKRGEEHFYLINAKGQLITKEQFAELGPFNDNGVGIAAMLEEGKTHWSQKKFGLIDRNGKWLLEPTFRKIAYLNNQLHAWEKGRPKPFMIDEMGNELAPQDINENLPEPFDEVKEISNRYALGLYYNRNDEVESKIFEKATGKMVKDSLHYTLINPIRGDIFCAQGASIAHTKEGEYVVDSMFNELLPIQQRYFYKGQYMEGFRRISMGKVIRSWYDCEGNTIKVKMNGEELDTFHDLKIINDSLNYIYFGNDEGYVVSKEGHSVSLPYHLQSIDPIGHAGLLWIMPHGNKGVGLINQSGETVLPVQLKAFNFYNRFTQRAAFETSDKKAGLLDDKGQVVNHQLYEGIRYLGFNVYRVQNGKEIGVIDQDGKLILPMVYKSVFLQEGLLFATKDGKKSTFDISGKQLK